MADKEKPEKDEANDEEVEEDSDKKDKKGKKKNKKEKKEKKSKKEKEEDGDTEEEDDEEEEAKSKFDFGKLKIPLLIATVAVVAIATGLIFSGFIRSRVNSESKGSSKKAAKKAGTFVSMGDSTVNLAGGQSFLQISVTLELDGEDTEIKTQVKKKKPQIQDTVITVVSSKTAEELLTPEGKDKLKKEIKDKIESLVGTKKLTGVYFTTFIMQ